MSELELVDLEKRYGDTPVVRGLNLTLAQGEFVSLLGPSGCGKTTTLRMIAGFVTPTSGRIVLAGQRIDTLPPWKREIGMVFQNYALFPHMTAAQNVAFGLKVRHCTPAEMSRRVAEALELVELSGLGERYPSQLSGGQQQRVALARALVIEPRLLLLDEPLSNLDARLRAEVREEISRVQRRLGITTLFVTHDQEEALAMSDRVVVMERGIAVETAPPRELSENPRRLFSASFLGARSVLPGRVQAGCFVAGTLPALALQAGDPPGATHLVLRQTRLRVGDARDAAAAAWRAPGVLESTTYLGEQVACDLALEGGVRVRALRPSAERLPAVGAAVHLLADRDAISLIEDPPPT
jgi:putative spermidine/putrescine transport system ATP-binding protein